MNSDLETIAGHFKNARRVLFITGAGVSAESQIPTFRGATGAFADGLTEDGIPFEEVLSGETLRTNPQLSWKYLSRLELSMRGKVPNAAHYAMAALQSPERTVWIATQNIDELHQRAGSRNVFELHGNLRRIICTACHFSDHWETFESIGELPLCPHCQAVLRPDVVLYGEALPFDVMDAFQREQWRGFDLVFSVGTTSLFAYVIEPVVAAVQRGIPVVEINPEATSLSDWVDFRLAAPAGATLQKLAEMANSERG